VDGGRAALDQMIQMQAVIISYIDDFKSMMILSLAAIPLVLLRRAPAMRAQACEYLSQFDTSNINAVSTLRKRPPISKKTRAKCGGNAMSKTALVVSAHPGDFVWRAGGAIALHAKRGYRVKIVCLAFGERGESQFAWKQPGMTLDKVKAGRRDEAERAAVALGAEIEFFDAGDYPLRLTGAHLDRLIDIYREINPSFVLTHALEDPYNVDHPAAAAFAQQARIVAQAMGHKPQADYSYSAPPVFLFEPHQPEMCNFKPQVILNIDEVWDIKRKTFEILAAQKHLWAYYERVALQRGMQGGRNSGKAMNYGEAYQRLFPMVMEELA
jgi:4-oxalomesaconate hydratase